MNPESYWSAIFLIDFEVLSKEFFSVNKQLSKQSADDQMHCYSAACMFFVQLPWEPYYRSSRENRIESVTPGHFISFHFHFHFIHLRRVALQQVDFQRP